VFLVAKIGFAPANTKQRDLFLQMESDVHCFHEGLGHVDAALGRSFEKMTLHFVGQVLPLLAGDFALLSINVDLTTNQHNVAASPLIQ
jgi:hypothetical protein